MKIAPILFLAFTTLMASCSSEQAQETKSETVQLIPFDNYLEKFPLTELPLEIKGCHISGEGLSDISQNTDAPFAKDIGKAYKRIQGNGNYIAVISLGVGDCLFPVISTYDLSGKLIDDETISIGYCGSDCGYSCEEFMTLKKDFSIYTSDTIVSSDCDSLGNPIPETTEKYVIYRKGKITPNGSIELGDEIKQTLN